MAISKPRIAGKPAIERRRLHNQFCELKPVVPSEPYRTIVDGVPVVVPAAAPEWEGQMYFHYFTDDSGLNHWVQIYVVIDIGGTLTWKLAGRITQVNKFTGKPFDPIYD